MTPPSTSPSIRLRVGTSAIASALLIPADKPTPPNPAVENGSVSFPEAGLPKVSRAVLTAAAILENLIDPQEILIEGSRVLSKRFRTSDILIFERISSSDDVSHWSLPSPRWGSLRYSEREWASAALLRYMGYSNNRLEFGDAKHSALFSVASATALDTPVGGDFRFLSHLPKELSAFDYGPIGSAYGRLTRNTREVIAWSFFCDGKPLLTGFVISLARNFAYHANKKWNMSWDQQQKYDSDYQTRETEKLRTVRGICKLIGVSYALAKRAQAIF